jgi:hypothetical protein
VTRRLLPVLLALLGAWACSSASKGTAAPGSPACGAESCGDTCTDPANCGGCGNGCVPGGSCNAGVCECPAGHRVCNDVCVDLQTDPGGCEPGAETDGGSSQDGSVHDGSIVDAKPEGSSTDGPANKPEATAPCTPTGTFQRGNVTCTLPTQYCQETVSEAGTGYLCQPFTQSLCGCTPSCGCAEFTSLCTNNNASCSMSGEDVTLVCHVQGV